MSPSIFLSSLFCLVPFQPTPISSVYRNARFRRRRHRCCCRGGNVFETTTTKNVCQRFGDDDDDDDDDDALRVAAMRFSSVDVFSKRKQRDDEKDTPTTTTTTQIRKTFRIVHSGCDDDQKRTRGKNEEKSVGDFWANVGGEIWRRHLVGETIERRSDLRRLGASVRTLKRRFGETFARGDAIDSTPHARLEITHNG